MGVDAALFTVEHTGTRFFKQLLVPHTNLIQFHCRDKHEKEVHRATEKSFRIYTTYRNPTDLKKSWETRGKDLKRLEQQMMFWRVHVLPVSIVLSFEYSLRDKTAEILQREYGIDKIDWSPVGDSISDLG